MNNNMTPTPWAFDDQSRNGSMITGSNGKIILLDHRTEEMDMPNLVKAVNSTYGNGIDPSAVKKMYDLLVAMVDKEEKAYIERKKSADHFNNNTDGVGIKFDYEIPYDMPKWVLKAKAVLDKAILKP